jgi:hypothetical protein
VQQRKALRTALFHQRAALHRAQPAALLPARREDGEARQQSAQRFRLVLREGYARIGNRAGEAGGVQRAGGMGGLHRREHEDVTRREARRQGWCQRRRAFPPGGLGVMGGAAPAIGAVAEPRRLGSPGGGTSPPRSRRAAPPALPRPHAPSAA